MTATDLTMHMGSGKRGPSIHAEQGSLGELAMLNHENPRAASLMLLLMANMDGKGEVVLSQAALAKLSNCSLSTVKRSIACLVEGDWVQAVNGNPGSPLAYVVNSSVARPNKRKR
ncbi:hypothetical protein [Pseudomonas sp. PB3P13]